VRIVLDTNVLRSGIRSAQGASREVLSLVDEGVITPVVSVSLVFEYESVLKREEFLREVGLSTQEVNAIVNYIVSRSHLQQLHFLWRPFLPDAGDDCVLECAINGRAQVLLTFNKKHFPSVQRYFGIAVLTPGEFLRTFGGS
jgi:putative PIN family toxin of toxin-antitoxin system